MKVKRLPYSILSLIILLVLVFSYAPNASCSGKSEFDSWPPSSEIISGIDAVFKELNAGSISEDDAVKKIRKIIPKPANYPKRPIELVIGWGPGGGSDMYMRNIGKEVAKFLDVPLVFVNMPGANSEISNAYEYAKKPDGYSLLSVNGSPIANELFNKLPYDFINEMTPIFSGQGFSEAMFVRQGSPFKTWDDVIAWAKENPGRLTVATAGVTTDDQFVMWKIMDHFNIELINMGFASSGERRTGVLGGHIDVLADSVGTVNQLLLSGELRPLLYYGPKRYSEINADIPCMGDYGLDIKTLRWRGVAAPPKLPKDIQYYLYYIYYAAHQMPEYKKYESQNCLQYSQPWAKGPEELKKFWQEFYDDGKKLVDKFNKK